MRVNNMPIQYTLDDKLTIRYLGENDTLEFFERYVLPTLSPKPTNYSYITEEVAQSLQAPTLADFKSAKIDEINNETSAAILYGFDYIVNEQILHISYDRDDQQNFSDMAEVIGLVRLGLPIPLDSTIEWNGWKIIKGSGGSIVSKQLVKIPLTHDEFLQLYLTALAFKNEQMAEGTRRKKAVNNAKTIEELKDI